MARKKIKKKANEKKRNRFRQCGPAYWMAVGTLAAYTTCSEKGVMRLYAQQDRRAATTSSSSGQTRSLTVHQFEIAPGALHDVLDTFQRTAGVQILVPQQTVLSIWSPGVNGLYTLEQAVQKILVGTGLVYRFTTPTTVIVEIAGPSTTVEVTTNVLPDTLPKYTEPLLDTPQTISVVSHNVMETQGTTTLRDALRNVAGISLAAGEGGAQGDSLTIRGFTARNDIFLDGMRDFGSYYRDPFDMQEVDVLQGPASVVFGRGSTGGIVNQTTKTPQRDGFITGSLDFGTELTRRVTADLDRPLQQLGPGAAFRLNVMGQDSNVAGRDIAESRRAGIAPSLALGLGTPTRFTLSYFHQSADDIPDYGIPWLFDGPAPVRRENYYGFEHGNYLKTHVNVGTAKLEHDFSDKIKVRTQLRYAHYKRDARITEALIASEPALDTPLDNITINRNQIAVDSLETFLDDQTDVTASFRTGFIQHTFVGGIEAARETSSPVRTSFTDVPGTSLVDPDTSQSFSGEPKVSSRVHVGAGTYAAYALDTLRLTDRWQAVAGVRVDRFGASYNQTVAPAAAFSRVDVMTSWRTALVYKPAPSGSIYFDYGTSFNPSAESLSLSSNNVDTPPEQNKTYEIGTKWDLYSRKMSLRAALFRTDKTNAREPDPNNPALNVLAGSQRVNGVSLEASGRLTDRWQLLTSYALLDSKVVSSKFYPASIGAQLGNVPRNSFSLWSNYQLPWRLDVGGGADFVDSRTASSTARFDPTTGFLKRVPGYWVSNAMARYPLSERVDLQVNVYNLTDKYYYDQLHPRHIVPGPGRSALVGLNFKF